MAARRAPSSPFSARIVWPTVAMASLASAACGIPGWTAPMGRLCRRIHPSVLEGIAARIPLLDNCWATGVAYSKCPHQNQHRKSPAPLSLPSALPMGSRTVGAGSTFSSARGRYKSYPHPYSNRADLLRQVRNLLSSRLQALQRLLTCHHFESRIHLVRHTRLLLLKILPCPLFKTSRPIVRSDVEKHWGERTHIAAVRYYGRISRRTPSCGTQTICADGRSSTSWRSALPRTWRAP